MNIFISALRSFSLAVLYMYSFTCSSQSLPTDGGFPPIGPGGNWGNWTGDTIIKVPIKDLSQNTMSLTSPPCVMAIYDSGTIRILSEAIIHLTYEIKDEYANTIICTHTMASPHFPTILDLTTLPSGHYTLLLYINRECLEGEFEKD